VTLDDRVSANERWTFTLVVAPSTAGPLRLVFIDPVSDTVLPINVAVLLRAEAFHTRHVPVTLTCSLVCTAGAVCNLALGTTSGMGRASSFPFGVFASSPATAEYRCETSAEGDTISGVRVISWQ
jgi:hypothetical protein